MQWRLKRLRLYVLALLLALILAACGGRPAAATTGSDSSSTAEVTQTTTAVVGTDANTATTRLNLNTATADDLLSAIPGLGDRMVREFFEYRPYVSIEQFRREIGKYVSAEQVAAYEQYVYVPIDVNQADAATLQQLPGVDATIAAALIAARPYDSNAAFLAKLGEYVSSADLAVAAPYLAGQ